MACYGGYLQGVLYSATLRLCSCAHHQAIRQPMPTAHIYGAIATIARQHNGAVIHGAIQ